MKLVFDSLSTAVCFLVIIVLCIAYIYTSRMFDYWKDRGVKFVEPLFLIGNYERFIFSQVNRCVVADTLYKKYPFEKFFGLYHVRSAVLVMRDPSLIHKILNRDFHYFQDAYFTGMTTTAMHTLPLNETNWDRRMFASLFKTEKLKTVVPELELCSQYFDEILRGKCSSEIEICEVISKFNLNMIASVAFGCDMNSFKKSDVDCVTNGRELFRRSFLSALGVITDKKENNVLKIIRGFQGVKKVPDYVRKLYLCYLKEVIAHRERNKLHRSDFIQVIINVRKERRANGTKIRDCPPYDLFLSNFCIFITAGFETVSHALSTCLLELADNLDVQRKLREEILKTMRSNSNSLTYEVVNQMKYMDKVISETFRKYPVGIGIIRICTKNYRIPETDIIIEKGIPVYIPVYSIHRDPEYYQNPATFDPERFSEGNMQDRQNGTYLPFGDGPKSCVGRNFVILQMKVSLAYIISNYKFTMTTKTSLPLEFSCTSVYLEPKDGIWLKVEKLPM